MFMSRGYIALFVLVILLSITQAAPYDGQSCSVNADCASNLCNLGICEASVNASGRIIAKPISWDIYGRDQILDMKIPPSTFANLTNFTAVGWNITKAVTDEQTFPVVIGDLSGSGSQPNLRGKNLVVYSSANQINLYQMNAGTLELLLSKQVDGTIIDTPSIVKPTSGTQSQIILLVQTIDGHYHILFYTYDATANTMTNVFVSQPGDLVFDLTTTSGVITPYQLKCIEPSRTYIQNDFMGDTPTFSLCGVTATITAQDASVRPGIVFFTTSVFVPNGIQFQPKSYVFEIHGSVFGVNDMNDTITFQNPVVQPSRQNFQMIYAGSNAYNIFFTNGSGQQLYHYVLDLDALISGGTVVSQDPAFADKDGIFTGSTSPASFFGSYVWDFNRDGVQEFCVYRGSNSAASYFANTYCAYMNGTIISTQLSETIADTDPQPGAVYVSQPAIFDQTTKPKACFEVVTASRSLSKVPGTDGNRLSVSCIRYNDTARSFIEKHDLFSAAFLHFASNVSNSFGGQGWLSMKAPPSAFKVNNLSSDYILLADGMLFIVNDSAVTQVSGNNLFDYSDTVGVEYNEIFGNYPTYPFAIGYGTDLQFLAVTPNVSYVASQNLHLFTARTSQQFQNPYLFSDIFTINGGYYGGVYQCGVFYGYSSIACFNSTQTFTTHICDNSSTQCGYVASPQIPVRLVSDCGTNNTVLTYGNFAVGEANVTCVMPSSTQLITINMYLQTITSTSDYTVKATDTITVANGVSGVSCNINNCTRPASICDSNPSLCQTPSQGTNVTVGTGHDLAHPSGRDEEVPNEFMNTVLNTPFVGWKIIVALFMIIGAMYYASKIDWIAQSNSHFTIVIAVGVFTFILATFLGLIPPYILIILLTMGILFIILWRVLFPNVQGGN